MYLLASDSHEFLIVYYSLIMIVILFPTDITAYLILDAVMRNTSSETTAYIRTLHHGGGTKHR